MEGEIRRRWYVLPACPVFFGPADQVLDGQCFTVCGGDAPVEVAHHLVHHEAGGVFGGGQSALSWSEGMRQSWSDVLSLKQRWVRASPKGKLYRKEASIEGRMRRRRVAGCWGFSTRSAWNPHEYILEVSVCLVKTS